MTEPIIDKILQAVKYEDIITPDADYKKVMKMIHPDLCKDPRAGDASAKLSEFHNIHTNGIKMVDDSGIYRTNYFWAKYEGEQMVIEQGRQIQAGIAKHASLQLSRYMPYEWETKNCIKFLDRALPLAGQTLPQEHVNWIVSRLIEFCMLLHKNTGWAHLGLTPDNIFLVPTTHGISAAGFYHAAKLGSKMGTVSAKYKIWYPASTFTNKIATEAIDIHMVKRIGAYLLGDKSGVGTRLLRTHNKDFVNFLLSSHTDSKECFKVYRAMVEKNFETKFFNLNI